MNIHHYRTLTLLRKWKCIRLSVLRVRTKLYKSTYYKGSVEKNAQYRLKRRKHLFGTDKW